LDGAKVYTKDEIKGKLLTNNQWLIRGAMAIYSMQTAQEQRAEITLEDNGVGFNGVDAPFCSSLIDQWETRNSLSERQWAALRKCMVKYSGQLCKIANREIG